MIFCPLFSGSSGNSIFVSANNTKLLIDAGLPGRSIENALSNIGHNAADIDGIFITHEHTDHIKGAGVLSRKYDIPIYANLSTWDAIKNSIGKIKEHNIKIFEGVTSINNVEITGFNLSHDAAKPTGYSIAFGKKKACIATDLGFFSDEVKTNIEDADIVLLESNHDVEMLKFGPYPYVLKQRIISSAGHLSNTDCGEAILKITNQKFKRIILGHLSKTNNYPELAYKTVTGILRDNGVEIGKELSIGMARRDMPSNYIEI